MLDELAGRYRLRPLLAVVAGTPAATPAAAAAIVEGTHGGIVLDVSPRTDSPAAVAETVVELGELLGYVRVPAHELGAATAPGLLATLPPQVPVVIGEPPTAAAEPAHPAGPGIPIPSGEPAGTGTPTPSGDAAGSARPGHPPRPAIRPGRPGRPGPPRPRSRPRPRSWRGSPPGARRWTSSCVTRPHQTGDHRRVGPQAAATWGAGCRTTWGAGCRRVGRRLPPRQAVGAGRRPHDAGDCRRGGPLLGAPRRRRPRSSATPGRGRTGGPPDRGTPGRSCPAGARACAHRARGRLPRPRRDR